MDSGKGIIFPSIFTVAPFGVDKKSTIVRKSVFPFLFNWLIFSYSFGKLSIVTDMSGCFNGKAPGFNASNGSVANFLIVTLPKSPPSWSDIFLNIWLVSRLSLIVASLIFVVLCFASLSR